MVKNRYPSVWNPHERLVFPMSIIPGLMSIGRGHGGRGHLGHRLRLDGGTCLKIDRGPWELGIGSKDFVWKLPCKNHQLIYWNGSWAILQCSCAWFIAMVSSILWGLTNLSHYMEQYWHLPEREITTKCVHHSSSKEKKSFKRAVSMTHVKANLRELGNMYRSNIRMCMCIYIYDH